MSVSRPAPETPITPVPASSPEAPHPGLEPLSFPHYLMLAGILSFGVLLRCHRLNEISFWFDESFCWKMTTFPWAEQWERVARDNHPPLYFMLLKAWTQVFGDGAVVMRLLSVICGAIAMLGGFALVREAESLGSRPGSPPRAGWGAAYLAMAGLAVSPFQLEWSQQVRMYALGSALSLWSSWFLLRALHGQAQSRTRAWSGFVLTATLLAYTHYYGLFVIAAQGLYAVAVAVQHWSTSRANGASLFHVVAAFLVIGMLWSPWLPEFLAHRQQVVRSFWTEPLKLSDVSWTTVQMWTGTWTQMPFNELLAGRLGLLTAGLCLVVAVLMRGTRLLVLIPVMTFGLATLASLGPRNVVSARYFVFAQALLVCAGAVALQRLPTRPLRFVASCLALVGLSWLCWQTLQQRDRWAMRPGFESAVAYVEEQRQPGEPIFVGNPMVQINAVAYANDHDGVYVLSRHQDFPYFQGSAVMRDSDYVTPEKAATWPTERIWVLETRHWTGGSIGVSLPHPWIDLREEFFYDWHTPKCEVVIKECVRRRSATTAPEAPARASQESSHELD